MVSKKISTVIIIFLAVGISAYVIYDNQSGNEMDNNEQLLQEYLENEGLDKRNDDVNGEGNFEVTDEEGIFPGAIAKDFSLPVQGTDKTLSLSDYKGEFVVLNLWASWCPPCIKEMPDLISFHEDYQDEAINVIGVNMTTQEKRAEDAIQFIEDFEIPFLTVMDVDGNLGYDYQVMGIPITFLIDPDGRIIVRRQGEVTYNMLESYYLEAKQEYESN